MSDMIPILLLREKLIKEVFNTKDFDLILDHTGDIAWIDINFITNQELTRLQTLYRIDLIRNSMRSQKRKGFNICIKILCK